MAPLASRLPALAAAAALLAGGPAAAAGEVLGVFGEALKPCSQPGTALTGFTRDGKCQDMGNDDQGSHHICIKMKDDFCSVTGQPNWCAEKMQCMDQEGDCYIGNWCVCQWAFARYIDMAGGCDSIVDLECDATNLAAVKAYEEEAADDPTIEAALKCIKKKCKGTMAGFARLDDASTPPAAMRGPSHAAEAGLGRLAAPCLLLAAAGLAFAALVRGRGASQALESPE